VTPIWRIEQGKAGHRAVRALAWATALAGFVVG
jgi:hypothetical protein